MKPGLITILTLALALILGLSSCPPKKPPATDGTTSEVAPPDNKDNKGEKGWMSSRSESRINHLENARKAMEQGNYELARNEASEYITANPESAKNAEAQFIIAESYLKAGADEEARKELERFIANYPTHPKAEEARFELAKAYMRLGREAESRVSFETYISAYPESDRAAKARLEIAESYIREGEEAKARSEYGRYLAEYSRAGDEAAIHYEIALSYKREGRESEARHELQGMVAAYPATEYAPKSLYTLAIMDLRGGDEEAARQSLERIVKNYPESEQFAEAAQMLHTLESRKMQELPTLMAVKKGQEAERSKAVQDAIEDIRVTAVKDRVYVVLDLKNNVVMLKMGAATLYAFPVATGKGYGYLSTTAKQYKFATPRGKHTVLNKNTDPIWVRPNWYWLERGEEVPEGITLEERIIENHLGKYSVGIGDQVFFHGFKEPVRPGKYSHGCIRMNNDDLDIFFNLVEVGTEVYIF